MVHIFNSLLEGFHFNQNLQAKLDQITAPLWTCDSLLLLHSIL